MEYDDITADLGGFEEPRLVRREDLPVRLPSPPNEGADAVNAIRRALSEGDLERAEELTVRTHQLNTTGYTYSFEELDSLKIPSP